jgi:hypothetical protein
MGEGKKCRLTMTSINLFTSEAINFNYVWDGFSSIEKIRLVGEKCGSDGCKCASFDAKSGDVDLNITVLAKTPRFNFR